MVPIEEVARELGDDGLAVSLHDYETGVAWSHNGDRWFHSASTIKVAVLYALFGAVDAGRFSLESRLHVRNRFLSIVDGTPFRVSASRDGDRDVHRAIGQTMRLEELARHMIVTSSNLATNLLMDAVGVDATQQMLARHGIDGIEVARGVEDEKAFEESFNNRVTANGLVRLFRAIHDGRGLSAESARHALEILQAQEFRSGIPAGLPPAVRAEARVANKTGEISVAAHDAGIVFLPGRQPYVLAVLTEPEPAMNRRMERVARVSTIVYEWLTGGPPPAEGTA
ncbi:MAG TPA: serine hydrolase [Vicinamibacterales bacterium]|nr:serine hydrolase [Vicinamibacterales bacterium]